MNINELISSAIAAMRGSVDFTDNAVQNSFLELMECIESNPSELLQVRNKRALGCIAGTMLVSGFARRVRHINEKSTGILAATTGFYAYMKIMDEGDMAPTDFPGYVTLLHYGQDYIAEYFAKELYPQRKNVNPYDFFSMADYNDTEKKEIQFTQALEQRMIDMCKLRGSYDINVKELETELHNYAFVPSRFTEENDPFPKTIQMYYRLKESLASGDAFDFAEED